MTSSSLPSLDSGWQWQIWQGLPYVTCTLLENWRHGFFTQQFYPHPPEELVQVLQPEAEVYRLKQVHGNRVLQPGEIAQLLAQNPQQTLPEGDGVLTTSTNQSVWVASADCTPVLIADSAVGEVAAIHAGWRGTAKRIVPEAIARFLAQGSELENLLVAMGPAITGEVYQVSEQVAAEVVASVVDFADKELPNSPILEDSEPGKVRLDVRRVNELQIQQLGIKPEQISIAPLCTYQQPEYLFSYRRSQEKKVQWSGIVSGN